MLSSNKRVSLPRRGKGFCMGRIPIVRKKSNRRVRKRRQASCKKAAEGELSLAMWDLSLYGDKYYLKATKSADLELAQIAMGDLSLYVDSMNPTDNLIGTPIGTPNFSSHPADDLILGLFFPSSLYDDKKFDGLLAACSVESNDYGLDNFLATRSVDCNCGSVDCNCGFEGLKATKSAGDFSWYDDKNFLDVDGLLGASVWPVDDCGADDFLDFLATRSVRSVHCSVDFNCGVDDFLCSVDGVNPGVNPVVNPTDNLIGTPSLIGTPDFFSQDFHPADLILGSKREEGLKATKSAELLEATNSVLVDASVC